jgi:hypothetical protein
MNDCIRSSTSSTLKQKLILPDQWFSIKLAYYTIWLACNHGNCFYSFQMVKSYVLLLLMWLRLMLLMWLRLMLMWLNDD